MLTSCGGSGHPVRDSRRSAFTVTSVGPPPLKAPRAVRKAGGAKLREFEAGATAALHDGCLACHRIGMRGNHGPGPVLSHVGSRLSEGQIAHALVDPSAPMPSFRRLPRPEFAALVKFLSLLR